MQTQWCPARWCPARWCPARLSTSRAHRRPSSTRNRRPTNTEASSRAPSSPCNRRKSTRSLDLKRTSSPNAAIVKDGATCGIRPKRPTKKDGKPDYGFRWDGEVQKWVSNHRSNEAGGPPADGLPRHKKPAVGDLLIYFVFCPCAVGYFLWVSAPACWAALYAHVLAPVGGFVHDHLLVPLGKCLGACWDLLARACTALYKHVLVPIGTAVAAGAAAMGKCLGACWDLLARACTAFYKRRWSWSRSGPLVARLR